MKVIRRSLPFLGTIALMALPKPAWSTEPGGKPPAIVELSPGDEEASTTPRPGSVSVVNVDAIQAQIQRHRGHPLFLHFWASWCGPCLMELPLVNQWAERLRASGADVLSVSLDNPDQRAEHVLALLREKAPALTAAIARIDDPDRFIAAFHGVRGQPWEGSIPALFVFDKKGTLTRQLVGEASAADLAALARGAGINAGVKAGVKASMKLGKKRGLKPPRTSTRAR